MPTEECRLALLEQRLDTLCRELTEDKEDNKEVIKEIFARLNGVSEMQAKQKGSWATATFLFTALSGIGIAVYEKMRG